MILNNWSVHIPLIFNTKWTQIICSLVARNLASNMDGGYPRSEGNMHFLFVLLICVDICVR